MVNMVNMSAKFDEDALNGLVSIVFIRLYELSDTLAKPLCMIFNSSYDSGIVPESWKIGQITALFKYTRALQTVHNTPVMNILKGFFFI